MRLKGFDGMICPIAGVMAAIGDRWGTLILRDIVCGLSRYEEFHHSTGATHATLSNRLKHLEANNLIERRRYQLRPERFEYVLTEKGRHLVPLIFLLTKIGESLDLSGASAPPLKFVSRKTGAELDWAIIDQSTGNVVSAEDLSAEAGPGADDLVRWRISHGKARRRLSESLDIMTQPD